VCRRYLGLGWLLNERFPSAAVMGAAAKRYAVVCLGCLCEREELADFARDAAGWRDPKPTDRVQRPAGFINEQQQSESTYCVRGARGGWRFGRQFAQSWQTSGGT